MPTSTSECHCEDTPHARTRARQVSLGGNMQQQPAGDATVVGGVLASVTALVKKQGDTMIRHRTDIAAALPTLRRGDSASGVASAFAMAESMQGAGVDTQMSRSASPAKLRRGVASGAGSGGGSGGEVKIKDPLSGRLQRDLKELKQKMVEQASKHAMETEKLKKQLGDARVALNVRKAQDKQHAQQEAVAAHDAAADVEREQLKADGEELRARCRELEEAKAQLAKELAAHDGALATERQQRLALEHQLSGPAGRKSPAPAAPALESKGKAVVGGKRSLKTPTTATTGGGGGGGGKKSGGEQGQEGLHEEVVRLRTELYSLQVGEEEQRRHVATLEERLADLSAQLRDAQMAAQLAAASTHAGGRVPPHEDAAAQGQRQGRRGSDRAREREEREAMAAGKVEAELEQAASSLETLDMATEMQRSAQRQLRAAHAEMQALQAALDEERRDAEKRVDDVRARMSEQRAALEEQCAGLRRERNACKDELALVRDSAEETKRELLDAVQEVHELEQAQQRERERHAEAMTARDARVQELQVALARAEAVAEESGQARDKLVAELAHLRLQNEQVV